MTEPSLTPWSQVYLTVFISWDMKILERFNVRNFLKGLESLKNGSLLGDVGLEKFLNLAAEAAENGAKR